MRRTLCQRFNVAALSAILLCAAAPASRAQTAENVAVVINDDSPDSKQIGEHYAKTRALPGSNILRIRTSTDETIERSVYVSTIERPLGTALRRAGLQDRILYLVLTKGVPLRIAGTTGLNGTGASVDSELTLLYRRLTGQTMLSGGKIDNPYFLGSRAIADARPFTHRNHDIYLVTRIDAYTVEQALTLVNNAQAARTEGRIVLDQHGATTNRMPEQWLELAARRLAEQGEEGRVVLETTTKPARGVSPVLGYYSWGSTDPENRVRSVSMGFVPGSIAANLTSFDARTFRQPPERWVPTGNSNDLNARFEGSAQSLIGDLIRDGVTGVSGQVGEPYLLGAVRPDILFPAYLAGFNLAEAFYLATPTLSWQTIVVGDPLCAPFSRKALTRADLEEEVDTETGLPGLFLKRRIAEVARVRGVSERAIRLALRAETFLDRDDPAGGRRALDEAIQIAPEVPEWLLLLAGLDEQARDYERAIASYQRILKLQPQHVVALNNLAYALAVRRKLPAEALPLAKRAVALAPNSAVVLDTLGWIEHLAGNDPAAVKLLADAIQLDPTVADIRLHAAVVFASMGVRDRAESELKEALRLNPAIEAEARELGLPIQAVKP